MPSAEGAGEGGSPPADYHFAHTNLTAVLPSQSDQPCEALQSPSTATFTRRRKVSITLLRAVLDLVGKLDDSPGEDTPRERFRRHLDKNISDVGQIRDYVEECLRTTGDQYNRALQDLINVVGRFLGFDVTFGRYQGVTNQIGFDGLWRSPPTGFYIVVEVKTTDVFSVDTATVLDYVNRLIAANQISDWDHALGLYVIGRPNPDVRQIEHAIVAQKQSDQLRIISAEHLLSLAEVMREYDVRHEDVLAVIRPSGPTIDPVVDLLTRLVAESKTPETMAVSEPESLSVQEPAHQEEEAYWITPVASDEEATAEKVIATLVGRTGIYAFGDRTPGRARLKPGDWMCFYASGKGVVGHARVSSAPEKKPHPKVRHPDKYPWVFRLSNPSLYLDSPVVIDAEMRSGLDAFEDREPSKPWAWFVQATRAITEHDFRMLTR
jgi:hypothetical protein